MANQQENTQEAGNTTMRGLDALTQAIKTATNIVNRFADMEQTEDVIKARSEELVKLTKQELIEHVLTLERPKAEKTVKVEDVVKEIMTNSECAVLNYEQIAGLVSAKLGTKTSSKSVASYASKKGKEWGVVPRQRIKLDTAALLEMHAAANG